MGMIPRLTLLLVLAATAGAQRGGELRFCLHGDPKTFDPLALGFKEIKGVRNASLSHRLRIAMLAPAGQRRVVRHHSVSHQRCPRAIQQTDAAPGTRTGRIVEGAG